MPSDFRNPEYKEGLACTEGMLPTEYKLLGIKTVFSYNKKLLRKLIFPPPLLPAVQSDETITEQDDQNKLMSPPEVHHKAHKD